MLSFPREVDYIHEPFNPRSGMSGLGIDTVYVRPSIESEEERRIDGYVQQAIRYNIKLAKFVDYSDPWLRRTIKRIVGGRGAVYLRFAKLNSKRQVSLFKDPTAPLMADYLATNYGFGVVLVVKHPLSYYASLKRLKWWPHPPKLFEQVHLVEDHLDGAPLTSLSDWLRRESWDDPVVAAGVHWSLVHYTLLAQQKKHADWKVILHEELSARPVETFRDLYEHLGLRWSDSARQKIERLTGVGDADARSGKVQDFRRQSDKIFQSRVDSIELADRKKMFQTTREVALRLYPESTFGLG